MNPEIQQLTLENYREYALFYYDNPTCKDYKEFVEDLEERPKWIKRLFRKYKTTGELREVLVLNHIVGFYNTFPGDCGTKILMFKLEEELHPFLFTYLKYLNYSTRELEQQMFARSSVSPTMDTGIVQKLREMNQ